LLCALFVDSIADISVCAEFKRAAAKAPFLYTSHAQLIDRIHAVVH